jgi:hypothetical protein
LTWLSKSFPGSQAVARGFGNASARPRERLDKTPQAYEGIRIDGFTDVRLIGPIFLFLVLLVARWRNDRP